MKMNTLLNESQNHGALVSYYFQRRTLECKSFVLCVPSLILQPSVFLGKPASYAEYFSLSQTTAELQLLKPISREEYQHLDLVIKVITTTSTAK